MESKYSYSIALDIGTNSIGYVVFETAPNLVTPLNILDLGVRIFGDGRDAQTKTPLAVERRTARGMRRNRDRNKNRISRLIKELTEFGLLPSEQKGKDKVFELCPYQSRNDAVEKKVNRATLARALVHIAGNRGFKSNRLNGDAEDSSFFEKIQLLNDQLKNITLGQFLFARKQKNDEMLKHGNNKDLLPLRFKPNNNAFFPTRLMLEDEFKLIKKTQNKTLSSSQWDALEETIFWQYPLRPVEKGRCRFYPDEARAFKDLPIAHEFRILQDINNLAYSSQGIQHKLDERQRRHVVALFNRKKSITFKSLLKEKDEHKSPFFPSDAVFNLDTPVRKGKLEGNTVLIDLFKPELLGALAISLTYDLLNEIVNHLIEPLKRTIDPRTNNEMVVAEEFAETREWLKEKVPQLSEQQVDKLLHKKFAKGTTQLSAKFMSAILPFMRKCMQYHDAVQRVVDKYGIAFHHSQSNIQPEYETLPYYGKILTDSVSRTHSQVDENKSPHERDENAYQFGKIANPTVHIALNQVRYVVNKIIKKFECKPAAISIELTRDLKNSVEQRKKIERQNKLNGIENERIKKDIETHCNISNPSREDVLKYKLWEELGALGTRQCVFTGQPISARQLFNDVEIEHIVPFSRSYDDGRANKTLAFKGTNQEKGNRTPYEAFGANEEYQLILKRALKAFGQSSKFERFKASAFEKFYGEQGERNFIERQLNDTKYITKAAKTYLSCIIPERKITPVNGQITAMLRKIWGLNRFKNKQDGHYRDDHRHHIVDAFVVGLTNRVMIQQINTINAHRRDTEKTLFELLKNRVKPHGRLIKDFLDRLEGVVVSYKADRSHQGSMFNDTAYGYDELNNTYITTEPLSSLSIDKLFKIRDPLIRQSIFSYLVGQPDIENKKKFLAAFGNPKELEGRLLEFSNNTKHRKVRINVSNNSIRMVKSAPFKGYALNSYAYVNIWKVPKIPKNKLDKTSHRYEGQFVPVRDAKKPVTNNDRPSHLAKLLMRLYKHDSISLTDKQTGEISYHRVAGLAPSLKSIDLQANLAAKGHGPGGMGDTKNRQNQQSINKLFSQYKIAKLRG